MYFPFDAEKDMAISKAYPKLKSFNKIFSDFASQRRFWKEIKVLLITREVDGLFTLLQLGKDVKRAQEVQERRKWGSWRALQGQLHREEKKMVSMKFILGSPIFL